MIRFASLYRKIGKSVPRVPLPVLARLIAWSAEPFPSLTLRQSTLRQMSEIRLQLAQFDGLNAEPRFILLSVYPEILSSLSLESSYLSPSS